MDGFRRMWGMRMMSAGLRSFSADHIPVSALHLCARRINA